MVQSVDDPGSALVAPGGAVLAIVFDARGEFWIAAEAGIWRGRIGAWRPVEAPPPLTRVNALLALGERPLLLAGGAPATIAYSVDAGASWHVARADEVEVPITCLAASPRFGEDRTLLAGTAGAGMLRSTDGGRSWSLSNAGLQEFTIFALVTAPAWAEREVAFAVTEGGLYSTPNGGRYWRRVADCDADLPLLALAVSAAFAEDGRVFAAGEQPGLFSSEDGGRRWSPRLAAAAQPQGVNCLLVAPAALFAGTAGGSIWRSVDAGDSWQVVADGYDSVLALAGAGATLAAGRLEAGLLCSSDGGATWAVEAGLGLRDLTRLALASDGSALAFGPSGGVWLRMGAVWRRFAGAFDAPITALLTRPDGRIFVGGVDGLRELSTAGAVSVEGFPGDAPATALCGDAEVEWLGDAAGGLWRRAPDTPWQPMARLAPAGPVLALAARGSSVVVASAADNQGRGVSLLRSLDGGARWALWLEAPATSLRVALDPDAPYWAAIGSRVWRFDGTSWLWDELDGRIVVALRRSPAGALIVATSGGAYRRNGDTWERLPLTPPPGGLLDLLVLPDGGLLGLGPGGTTAALAPGSV